MASVPRHLEGLPSRGPDTADEAGRDRADDPVDGLAERWAALVPDGPDSALVAQLTTALRTLATILRAEPFWPLAARRVGAELVGSPLLGSDRTDPQVEDVVAPSFALLRREAPVALGLTGPDGEHRVAETLDEMAAGLIGALRRTPDSHSTTGALSPSPRQRQIRAVYLNAALGIAIADLDGRVLDVNPALRRLIGLAAPMEEPRPVSDFVHPDDMGEVLERLARVARGAPEVMRMDMRLVRVDSAALWVHATASLVRDDAGEPSHLMAVVEDLSERQRLRARLESASPQDQLTGLPTRAVVEQWLRLAAVASSVSRIGVCSLDLDGFHLVNESLGEQLGDKLLLAVAGRLQLTAGGHLVARTGADEFVVLVAAPECAADVTDLADRLHAVLAMPFHVGGHVLSVTASIGVTEGPATRAATDELVRGAEVAQSWAKALGGNRRVVFDPARDTAEAARFALLSGLPGAVEREEFRLVFQPLVAMLDRRVRGVEALVRWQHPEQGLIGPARFIQLAEYSGAIVPLGRWVLEAACAQAVAWWRELGPDAPFVSVNVSPVQLAEPEWRREVTDVLAASGLPPHQLQLEITEQAVLVDVPAVLDALGALRDVGVRLALDDFGTGYSSLSWLRRLPVHALKIDGSFIDGLRHPRADPTDVAIVEALIGLAHALELEVTAEWVETDLQAERLSKLGCDLGQGFGLGDPGPAEWVPEVFRRSIGR